MTDSSPGTICVFWLGERCYGLDIALVGELVSIDRVAPVPLAPSEVLGVFSLRGAPTALVDLVRVLGLPQGDGATRGRTALVMRTAAATLCAATVERVDAVMQLPAAATPPQAGAENPAVCGFVDARGSGGHLVTLLDANVLVERLTGLRFTRYGEE